MTKAERVQVQNALNTKPGFAENRALEERISLASGQYEARMVDSALREAEYRMVARMRATALSRAAIESERTDTVDSSPPDWDGLVGL